jgi:hypothetical protein
LKNKEPKGPKKKILVTDQTRIEIIGGLSNSYDLKKRIKQPTINSKA